MANTTILERIKSSGSFASVDAKWGPYASVAAAHAKLGENGDDVAVEGLTVGIVTGNTVTEYWYQGGTTQAHLVPKQAVVESTPEIDITELDDMIYVRDGQGLVTQNVNIDIVNADSPLMYNVVGSVTANGQTRVIKVGVLFLTSDSSRHTITQILITHFVVRQDGGLDPTSHSDSELLHVYRNFYMQGAHGIEESERNKWSKWKRFNSDYFEQIGAMLAAKADKSYVDGQLEGKVSAVPDKGLSTNDYTNEEKAKVDAAAAHADFAYEKLVGGGDSGNIELVMGMWWSQGLRVPDLLLGGEYFVCNGNNTACVPGDEFVLTGSGTENTTDGEPRTYLWAFGDSEGVITRHAELAEVHETPFTVVAEEGEAFFYHTAKYRGIHGPSVAKNSLYKKGNQSGIIQRVGDLENAVSGTKSACKMFNNPVNLKKPNLRILDLGNSYTGDAVHYLKDILDAAGIKTGFSLYTCVRGGSSFRSWVNLYKKEDNYTYAVQKQAGDIISGVTQGPSYSGLDNSWFIELLKKGWDIILIHNSSTSSDNYEEWEGDDVAGGLTEYLRIIKTYCPQATIGFYLIHSHPAWNESSQQTGNTSTERWQRMVDGVKWLKANYGIDFIIPYGTAVENLRMTSINPLDPIADDGETKNDFMQDGNHLSSGIGDYVAACTYFETLFAPRYNVTVLGNTFRKQDIEPTEDDITNYGERARVSIVPINDANALLAQRAAILAVNDMFNLHNPETSTYFSQDVEEAGDNDSFIPKAGDTNSYMEYNPILPTVGTSAQRNAMILKSKDVGFQFFDTSLKKPVYVAAVSADGLATWVNATGTAEAYMVTYNLTGVHLIDDKASATANTNYSTTIEEDEGYALPSAVTVKVNGASLIPGTHYDYDSETGEIVILSTSVNGAITIEATGADPNAQGGGGQTTGPSHESQEPAWVFGGTLPATLSGDGNEQGSGSEEDWQLGDELPATLSE